MSSKPEVASFLKDFKEKMRFWDVLFRDERGKNTQALLDLEFCPVDRNTVLQALEVNNFSKGPVKEELYRGADMWVFGKTIKKREVYIKITMGTIGSSVICISFHLAQHKMNYPFK
jgi:hypothetical protein